VITAGSSKAAPKKGFARTVDTRKETSVVPGAPIRKAAEDALKAMASQIGAQQERVRKVSPVVGGGK
jgi:hypothetical protein